MVWFFLKGKKENRELITLETKAYPLLCIFRSIYFNLYKRDVAAC